MKKMLTALVLIAVAGAAGWFLGPELWSDFQIRDAKTQTANVSIGDASCRTKLFVLSFCTIAMTPKGQAEAENHYYLMVSSMGGETLEPLRTSGASDVLTTNIGQNYLMNRIASFLGLMIILLGWAGTTLFGKNEEASETTA